METAMELNPQILQAVKIVLKYEIKALLQRLAETGEESMVLLANIEDGGLERLGSITGEKFFTSTSQDLKEIQQQFVSFCTSGKSIDTTVQSRSTRAKENQFNPSIGRQETLSFPDRENINDSDYMTSDQQWVRGGNSGKGKELWPETHKGQTEDADRHRMKSHRHQPTDKITAVHESLDVGFPGEVKQEIDDEGDWGTPVDSFNTNTGFSRVGAECAFPRSMLAATKSQQQRQVVRKTNSKSSQEERHGFDPQTSLSSLAGESFRHGRSGLGEVMAGTPQHQTISNTAVSNLTGGMVLDTDQSLSSAAASGSHHGSAASYTATAGADDPDLSYSGSEGQYQTTFGGLDTDNLHFSQDSEAIKNTFVEIGQGAKCLICNKILHNKNNRTFHWRSHVGDKRYKCDICGKAFTHPSNMRSHRRVHTGEKPFPCVFCDKKYRRRDHLQAHMEKFHFMSQPAADIKPSQDFLPDGKRQDFLPDGKSQDFLPDGNNT